MQAQDFINDIPHQLAQNAHAGTSFSPEKRAEQERNGYAEQLAADWDTLSKLANTTEKQAQLLEEFARYREGYRRRYVAELSAKSRCVSSMIAGPARFPVERMRKRSETAHRRLEELLEFRERALRAIRKTLCPEAGPILSSDANAVDLLGKKIEAAEKSQEMMKQANAVIKREHKNGKEAQLRALIAEGLTEDFAAKILTPNCFGGIGFESYQLTNNGANIRRMKARQEQVKKVQALPEASTQGTAARLEDSPADNRVRLFYPGKPADDVRAALKSRGFRWTPSLGCWQAFRNHSSMEAARTFANPPKPQTFADRIADKTKTELATHFINWVGAVATLNGKTDTEIWTMWQKHVKENDAMDQSATLGEFCTWNSFKDPEREAAQ